MSKNLAEKLTGEKPSELRAELQKGKSRKLRRRRAIIGLSLVGMGAMTAVSLLQTGIVKHLPDPPVDNFDSDKVNSSAIAYALGAPDGTLSLASFAANIPLAAFGGANRAEVQPLIPLLAAGKSVVELAFAGWLFYRMKTKENVWCGYCLIGEAAILGIALLSLPEAAEAFKTLTKD